MLLWIAFIVCTSVIVYSGTRLSKYGDIIAEKTGLGRTWIVQRQYPQGRIMDMYFLPVSEYCFWA